MTARPERAVRPMLAYPLLDQAVGPQALRRLEALRAAPGGLTLQGALSALLADALEAMARRAHGARAAQDPAFRAGAAAFADEQSERLLWALEHETLVPLCDFDGTDAIYAELAALGRRQRTGATDHAGR